MNKATVVYHSADYDGIFCREIARQFLPDAELIGWNYGDPKLPVPQGTIYILDLSPNCLADPVPEDYARLTWIDHHKTAIDKFPADLRGYRIDGVAACRLAWSWFGDRNRPGLGPLPDKTEFVERTVLEPLAVRLAGEYDVWDHRGDGDLEFQFGLDAQLEIPWARLLAISLEADHLAGKMVEDGGPAMACYAKRDASVMKYRSFLVGFEGLNFLALNSASGSSRVFASRDQPETGHDALMALYWTGTEWSVTLYHASHRTDIDLSQIALRYGGGGHKGACGFRARKLPFIT